MKFWTAVSLANNKKLDDAIMLFKDVFKNDKNWRLLTERLPDSGLLNLKEEDLERILSLK